MLHKKKAVLSLIVLIFFAHSISAATYLNVGVMYVNAKSDNISSSYVSMQGTAGCYMGYFNSGNAEINKKNLMLALHARMEGVMLNMLEMDQY